MSSCVSPVSLEKRGDVEGSSGINNHPSPTNMTAGGEGFRPDKLVVTSAAFNRDFLKSSAGRTMRLLAEFEEYPRRMERLGVRGTYLFFGSARSKYPHQYQSQMAALEAELESAKKLGGLALTAADEESRATKIASIQAKIDTLKTLEWTGEYMEKTEELAKKLTTWALSPEGREAGMWSRSHIHPNPAQMAEQAHLLYGPRGPALGTVASVKSPASPPSSPVTMEYTFEQPLAVCTGGGPGFMEAGNKGAYEAGGVSMGVAITLPFETELNPFVTPGLHFQMDYFFSRKFWEVFTAKAMICCPGGMGTCDEMFEVLTLLQTQHCQPMPIVLLGKEFWTDVINWDKFAKYGVISKKEVDAMLFTDSVDEAFEFITSATLNEAATEKKKWMASQQHPRQQ